MGSKFFLKSKGVIGVIIAAIPLISSWTGIAAGVLSGSVDDVVQIAGLVLALWGRLTARERLTALPTFAPER